MFMHDNLLHIDYCTFKMSWLQVSLSFHIFSTLKTAFFLIKQLILNLNFLLRVSTLKTAFFLKQLILNLNLLLRAGGSAPPPPPHVSIWHISFVLSISFSFKVRTYVHHKTSIQFQKVYSTWGCQDTSRLSLSAMFMVKPLPFLEADAHGNL